jgi:histidine triad (HIT) family protein
VKPDCVFCRIAAGEIKTDILAEDADTLTFLDQSPMFPGHILIVPRQHVDTLLDLPDDLLAPFFAQVKRAAKAVELALEAHGSFVAINNRISQSVPHLHAHVIPRRKGDGMKGFFWPRRDYTDDSHRSEIVAKLRAAFRSL